VLLILNITFLDGQHHRDTVHPHTDPKRELAFSWLVIPGISTVTGRTCSPFEITRTGVHKLGWINEILMADPSLKLVKDNRLSLAKPFKKHYTHSDPRFYR